MEIKVGTFNLNNLFSRFNFKGEIEAIQGGDTEVTITYTFNNPTDYDIRTHEGKLVKGKSDDERMEVTRRIREMNLDVLAAQEVEDIDTLRRYVQEELEGIYPYQVLIEGNDPRLIDVAVVSKFPIGSITSWQYEVHEEIPNEKVFSRDLLQVEILNPTRSAKLFTLFNTHLKSQYVSWKAADKEAEIRNAAARRRRQAETILRIVKTHTNRRDRFIILGDMNDTPDSEALAPLVDSELGLVNGLDNPQETRPAKADTPPPASPAWTHRFKEPNQPARYELFDQIWLSPALATKLTAAWIDRRKRHSGDGSDHDPAWVYLRV
jgi:endonuclease/exonuclease/phosphatase family metal-dependent hydrolase